MKQNFDYERRQRDQAKAAKKAAKAAGRMSPATADVPDEITGQTAEPHDNEASIPKGSSDTTA